MIIIWDKIIKMIKTYWMCVLVQEGDNVIRTGVLSLCPIITIFFLFIFLYIFSFYLVFFSFFSLLFILFLYNSLPLFYHYKKYNVEYNIYKQVSRHECTLDTYIQNIYISIVIGVTEGSNGPWMFNYGRIFMELVTYWNNYKLV